MKFLAKGADFAFKNYSSREIPLREAMTKLFQECCRALDVQWGTLPLSHYDVTWMANLHDPVIKKPTRPRWIHWLIHHQNPDGSWGYHTESVRPRFLATFQGYHVLSRYDRERRHHNPKIRGVVEKTRLWLLQHQHELAMDWQDPAGYELILSSQLTTAESSPDLNLDFSDPHLRDVKVWRDRKVASLCDARVLAVMPILHSAESLGEVLPVKSLENHILPNGSIANSMASSAWLVNQPRISSTSRRRLHRYLSWCARMHPHPIKVFPVEITELAWTLGYMSMTFPRQDIIRLLPKALTRLHQACVNLPVMGFSSSFDVPDLDDTLMVHLLLRRFGLNPPTKTLNAMLTLYQAKDHWRTYALERGVSVATQVRALWAAPWLNNVVLEDVALKCLIHHRWKEFESWSDKYVPSPWYTITHLLFALHDHPNELLWPEMLGKILDWLESHQHPSGSYGIFMEQLPPPTRSLQVNPWEHDGDTHLMGTIEETALALICAGLLKRRWNLVISDTRVIQRALHFVTWYLLTTNSQWFSITWMAKAGLYALKNVVLATILAAMRLIQQEYREVILT